MSTVNHSPINDIMRQLTPRHNLSHKVSAILMAWVLHSMSTNEARASLKIYTTDAPAHISEILTQCRFDVRLYTWKVAALRALTGDTSLMDEVYINGTRQLLTADNIHHFKPPKTEQPLCLKEGEKILVKALQDVTPVILSLYKRKVNCVTRLMHGDALGMLKERAVLTYRWEYPFCRNPGATLNSAVSNYANNIIRDASAPSRSMFIGKKSDGTLESLVQTIDDMAYIQDQTESPSDLQFDLSSLSVFDQRVVKMILFEIDDVNNAEDAIAENIGSSSGKVTESFNRIMTYLQGLSGFNIAHTPIQTVSFNQW